MSNKQIHALVYCSIFLLMVLLGCQGQQQKWKALYQNHPFDKTVAGKLNQYDSLVTIILQNHPTFIPARNQRASYRFQPGEEDAYYTHPIPDSLKQQIRFWFDKIGADYIAAFDTYQDSTVRLHIRRKWAEHTAVEIQEFLSYYPIDTMPKKIRTFPEKDTMLNKHWQYWIRFSKGDFFE